jgi:hypothetical protein
MESTRMALVVVCPNSGNPELSSKIEPTAAIAAMEEPNKKIPLLGVTKSIPQLMTIIKINYRNLRKKTSRRIKRQIIFYGSRKPKS